MTALSVLTYIAYAFSAYYAIKAFREWHARRREIKLLKQAIHSIQSDIIGAMLAAQQQRPPAPPPAPPPGYVTHRSLLGEDAVAAILSRHALHSRDIHLANGQPMIATLMITATEAGRQYRIEVSYDPLYAQ